MSDHWVLTPTRNNLHLLKRAVVTFRAQDIGDIRIMIINNGSTDGTGPWLHSQHDIFAVHYPGRGLSVAASWNRGLEKLFQKNDHVFVVNNDTELHPSTYRYLLADGGEFVTAVGTREPKKIESVEAPDPAKKRRHPDFSAYLIRRSVWEKVGPFDEKYLVAFCEDADMHLRMHRAGVDAYALELPFLHHGSATVKNADPEEQQLIEQAAAHNRKHFLTTYGCEVGSEQYYREFNGEAPVEETESKEVAPI